MLLLRVAEPDDAAALGRVHVAAWRGAYAGLVPDAMLAGLSEQNRADRWAERLAQGSGFVLLAEAAGELIGFADAGPSRDADRQPHTGELYALYVLPEHWHTGAGLQLWSGARRWLAENGFTEATLWVLEGNARARRFYERTGWRLDPEATKVERFGGAALPEVRYRIGLE